MLSTTPRRRADPRGISSSVGEHPSPGLRAVLRRLDEVDGKRQILDLGPASGPNLAFFSRYPCRIHFADLFQSSLAGRSRAAGVARIPSDLEALVPLAEDVRLDAILAWQLFDYLSPDGIEAIVRRLRPHCRWGTTLLAMVSLDKDIPARPPAFRIVAEGRLRSERVGLVRPAPRYTETTLRRCMPGFSVEASFVLRNGLKESLFVYRPPRLETLPGDG